MTRPEAGDSDYRSSSAAAENWDGWEPWRPGDPTTAGEAPSYTADDSPEPAWSRLLDRAPDREPQVEPAKQDVHGDETPRKRWWSEDSPERFTTGDRVRNRASIGGDFMTHVQADTRGRVTGVELGVFSGEWVTVEFENGYAEEVRMSDLKRDSWF